MPISVTTPYGTFEAKRPFTKMISVVQARRTVTHYRKRVQPQEYTYIEHRKPLRSLARAKLVGGGWATYVATYDLEGTEVKFGEAKDG